MEGFVFFVFHWTQKRGIQHEAVLLLLHKLRRKVCLSCKRHFLQYPQSGKCLLESTFSAGCSAAKLMVHDIVSCCLWKHGPSASKMLGCAGFTACDDSIHSSQRFVMHNFFYLQSFICSF